jgi:predicted MFS family arabinose efflux permease
VQLSWRGVNFLLLGATAVSAVVEGHLVAFAPLQLEDLGLTGAAVGVWSGLLFAVTTATSLPLGPFWGVLAERFSHRTIILRSFLLLSAAVFVSSLAPDVGWLVASRALMGLSFGTGGVIVATQSLLTPRRRVGQAIAVVQASQPVAASIGPPLGAFAIPYIGIRGLYAVDAALLLATAALVALVLPEPTGAHKPTSVLKRTAEVVRMALSSPPIRLVFLNQLLARGAVTVVDSYLPVRITQVAADPAAAIGWILGAYGALTTLSAWALSRLADRVDGLRVYWTANLLGLVVASGLALAPWLWLIAALACLRSIPTAFSRPLLFMHLARLVPAQQQTGIFALVPTAGNVGGLLFPLGASVVAGLGTGAAIGVAVVAHASSALGGLRLARMDRR